MQIGCVIVSYNVPGIITRAVKSIKPYVDEVIIIDHSQSKNKAFGEADKLGVKVLHTHRNLGHGPGMDMGIKRLNSDYVIVMDSDTQVKDGSIVSDMLDMMEPDVYGVGRVIERLGVSYLHPYFAMIRRSSYLMYEPFVNHGAPCKDAMQSIHGKMEVIDMDMSKVWHEHRRTRERNKKIR